MPRPQDIDEARAWFHRYRAMGLNPLPSRMDEKRPLVRFREYWDAEVPSDLFDRTPTTNLQVMCGTRWRLIVVDLDGEEAQARWRRMIRRWRPSWESRHGTAGLHVWYRVPAAFQRGVPTGFLWKGQGGHSGIERIGDKGLIVAPPSIHPKKGTPYGWRNKFRSPDHLELADAPLWLLEANLLQSSVRQRRTSRHELRSLTGKPEIARRHGLRIAGMPSDKGWISCHAIGRPDERPSAAIHQQSGFYVDRGSGDRLNFVDLLIALRAYPDRATAVKALMETMT